MKRLQGCKLKCIVYVLVCICAWCEECLCGGEERRGEDQGRRYLREMGLVMEQRGSQKDKEGAVQ